LEQSLNIEAEIYLKHLAEDKEFSQDEWQKEVLDYEGNITIRAGRQVGKSAIIARKAAKLALVYPGTTTLMIAAAQRQSSLIFEKTMLQLQVVHNVLIGKAGGFKDNPKFSIRQNSEARRNFEQKYGIFDCLPTKTELRLKNGSRVYSLPAGKTGIYIKGFTIDFLIADEAAFIPEMVWLAVTPMIAVSRKKNKLGWIILLSTPFGKGGFFYSSHFDPDFKQFHISAEDCPRIGRDFLKKEQKRLSKIEYAQEYLGEFVDEYNQLFKTDLIKSRMSFISWDFDKEYDKKKNYYLGVDFARFGEDENGFVIVELGLHDYMRVVFADTSEKKSLTDTAGHIIALDAKYHFRKIFVDDAGIGAGAFDILEEKLHRRLVGINNCKKAISIGKGFKLLKEDLYSNAMVIMEREPKIIEIISDLKLLRSLKSMTFEYTADKNLKIYGPESHLSEAFVRALWCVKDRGLRIFIA
jgi:hypothetical protein